MAVACGSWLNFADLENLLHLLLLCLSLSLMLSPTLLLFAFGIEVSAIVTIVSHSLVWFFRLLLLLLYLVDKLLDLRGHYAHWSTLYTFLQKLQQPSCFTWRRLQLLVLLTCWRRWFAVRLLFLIRCLIVNFISRGLLLGCCWYFRFATSSLASVLLLALFLLPSLLFAFCVFCLLLFILFSSCGLRCRCLFLRRLLLLLHHLLCRRICWLLLTLLLL